VEGAGRDFHLKRKRIKSCSPHLPLPSIWPRAQADDIQNQINQVLEELEQIRNTRQVITDPDILGACERAILQATDKLVLR